MSNITLPLHSGLFVAGAAVVSLPILACFAANHAIKDLFEVYFYNNIFVYSGRHGKSLLIFLRYIASAVLRNPTISLPIVFFLIHVLRSKTDVFFKLCIFMLYSLHVSFIYIGCTAFVYYAFGMASLAAPGYIIAVKWLHDKLAVKHLKQSQRLSVCFCVASLFVGATISYVFSANSFFMHYNKAELWFEQFAAVIEESEDQSLFNYGTLDTGLYPVTGYVPDNRFFCALNLSLPEMVEEAENTIEQQKVEWIVTTSENNELLNEYYQLEMAFENFSVWKDMYQDYYLFRRK